MQQASLILDAAHRLVLQKGDAFTTQELVKEAGVALQTFYRYFASKDQLLLAVFAEMIAVACVRSAEVAADLPDPIARLRYFITSTLGSLDAEGHDAATARFIVSTHWRLQQNFPEEMAEAVRPFATLLLGEIQKGIAAGQLRPADPERAAWFINELIRSVYHHYAYAAVRPATLADDLWAFCLTALGGA
ncbi:TetR/AcrR family transcriptional regulator [Nocardia sp. alder85J]|nr:TetR/AcrR family transcriptional regulator [Nocardia sp. alder85J]MCX4090884.1 TetR/AcrR family transcriptional regulator [Nocardia sp. alder85J]